jgi:hypothetical protein
VGNRVAYVTNIFAPRTDTNEQLVSMLQRAKPGWTFTCVFGQSPQINTTAVQKTAELAAQASVEQLTIGPTGMFRWPAKSRGRSYPASRTGLTSGGNVGL